MKEITILSGKGGTGKTSVTAALAAVAENSVFCDNDVDAADLHLIFQPQINEEHRFSSGTKAVIDSNKCSVCNLCISKCRFSAIHLNTNGYPEINSFQCEGCRLCERICPNNAINSILSDNNYWFVSQSRFGELVHAQMGPGEENSGKLVTQIRKRAREIAVKTEADYVINDGPPGIGCATISSLSGTNAVLLVIEPTMSGFHDAKRLVELIEIFKAETWAVINKYDINSEVALLIENFLISKNIPLLAKISFDKEMVEAMLVGKSIVEYNKESEITKQIYSVWNSIKVNKNDKVA